MRTYLLLFVSGVASLVAVALLKPAAASARHHPRHHQHRGHHERHGRANPPSATGTPRSASPEAPPTAPDLKKQCDAYATRGVTPAACLQQALIAQAATAKYADINAAKTDGFVQFTGCVANSQGAAMGEHWARLDRMILPGVNSSTPQLLLYIQTPTGLKLLGAEYEETAFFNGLPHWGDQAPDGTASPAPVMFGGMKFDGPMEGHSPIQPWHYDLHVWLHAYNPAGLFAEYNPRFHC